MRNYTTQMDAARKGIVTKEMEIVAKKDISSVFTLALAAAQRGLGTP